MGARFLRDGLRGGMAAIAKVHQMLHLLHGAFLLHGNPRFYSCFIDESVKRDLAGIARVAYSTVWAERIFVLEADSIEQGHGARHRQH